MVNFTSNTYQMKREILSFFPKMVDYLKKALIYGHTSRISS